MPSVVEAIHFHLRLSKTSLISQGTSFQSCWWSTRSSVCRHMTLCSIRGSQKRSLEPNLRWILKLSGTCGDLQLRVPSKEPCYSFSRTLVAPQLLSRLTE